jgi:hypothetical protein
MKKVFAVILIAVFGAAFSQSFPTDKGSIYIDGSAAASFTSSSGDLYENSDNKGSTQISIMPSLGYFINPGLAIGGMVEYNKWSQGDNSSSAFGVGPQLTYFIGGNVDPGEAKGKMLPFITAAYLYESNTSKSVVSDYDLFKTSKVSASTVESKWTNTSIVVGGGLLHMLSSQVGAQLGVYYMMDSYKHEDADKAVKGNQLMVHVGIMGFVF